MIDTVESALAVIGIRAVISRRVEKVSMAQLHEMNDLEKQITKEAKGIVRGEPAKIPMVDVNYKKTLNELTEGFQEGQLEEMVAAFPPQLHSLSAQFIMHAQKVVQFLQSIFPIQTKTTLLGPENLPPAALAQRRFAVILDVIDDPRRILPHVACGSLLKSQTDAVKLNFPSISEAITNSLTEAALDEKSKKTSYNLPPRVEIGSCVWLGQPRLNPRLTQRLQQNFKAQAQEQPKPSSQAEGGSNSVIAKESMTNTQHTLFPQALNK